MDISLKKFQQEIRKQMKQMLSCIKKMTKNSTKSKDQILLLQVTEAPLTNLEGGL